MFEPLPTLPVPSELRAMFPEGGLVRGRTVLCSGDAAVAMALRVVSSATQAGSWLGIVGVHNVGVQAASEHGVALQRVVFVQPASSRTEWVSTVAAVADGFDVLMLEVPHGITEADARRVHVSSRRYESCPRRRASRRPGLACAPVPQPDPDSAGCCS